VSGTIEEDRHIEDDFIPTQETSEQSRSIQESTMVHPNLRPPIYDS
jgi:hypothetical protein